MKNNVVIRIVNKDSMLEGSRSLRKLCGKRTMGQVVRKLRDEYSIRKRILSNSN